MRGSVAKKLRKFAKTDMPDQPWAEYNRVQRSHHSPNTCIVLDVECQKAYYKVLKKIWKLF